ncbi:hypothetical protein GZH82_13570 [Staphylococcus ursi]|uniref:hypothetical protein n=1 Tax=Staphylococcus sp. MI 10-1553 TaxID=1912064 RepID=UPI0013979454|nr:hypothetical protein [Staphylococcus sp. MI 10-1553]QHW38270.1 hypothetical protein GZH82_13570 [Staphylococcus sp. MI 10-1553]
MKKWLVLMGVLLTIATSCSHERSSQQSQGETKQDKKEMKKEEQQKSDNAKSDAKKKEVTQQKTEDVSQLSDKMKLALAFSADEAEQYTLSKQEILTGFYDRVIPNEKQPRQLVKLYVWPTQHFSGVPKDMKIYSVYPPKSIFESLIGISNDKIFLGGTQIYTSYQELLKNGVELDLKTLYEKNKKYKSLRELEDIIEIVDESFEHDDEKINSLTQQEEPGIMAHLRSQVYQRIADFEGHDYDSSRYLLDNVRFNKSNEWYVNLRDKEGEIVATYTHTKDEPIIKLDAQGRRIK